MLCCFVIIWNLTGRGLLLFYADCITEAFGLIFKWLRWYKYDESYPVTAIDFSFFNCKLSGFSLYHAILLPGGIWHGKACCFWLVMPNALKKAFGIIWGGWDCPKMMKAIQFLGTSSRLWRFLSNRGWIDKWWLTLFMQLLNKTYVKS